MNDDPSRMKRKVQKLGSSTFGVSIPVEWARAHDIDKSDQVTLQESKNGESLLLIPERSSNDEEETLINADLLENEALERALISQYVLGRQIVRIEGSEPLKLSHHDGVLAAERRLMGLGAIEQRDQVVTVRCSVAPDDFDIPTLLDRLHRTEASMRDDAVTALIDGDTSTARVVSKRYPQVEKLYFLFLRLLFTTYQNPRLSQDVGLEADLPIIGFRSIAADILSMADAACEIATIAREQEGTPDAATTERIETLRETIDEAADIAIKSVNDRDYEGIERANDAFDRVDDEVESMNEHLATARPEPLLALQRSVVLLERSARAAENSISVATDLTFRDPSVVDG
ncbi:AbrB/MazE/SpoVT family DNA-binding domain-containing protein [Halosimplex rubrum]|nr:phosphate uptake regulator PhoU [Halosimplex rubrum]